MTKAATVFAVCLFTWVNVAASYQGEGLSALAATDPDAGSGKTFSEFPIELGGPFNLVDYNGVARSDRSFPGKYLLIYFGYAKCRNMCPIALRQIADAVNSLEEAGDAIQPILITVDPENDTLEAMKQALPKIHPRLLGLSGTKEALNVAYRAYKVKQPKNVGAYPDGTMVVSHTSYIYLISPTGKFLTMIPPIINGRRMGEIIAGYMS